MPTLVLKAYQERYFTKKLMLWNLQFNKRIMPWKGQKDPYKIWISEIILQQTRVAQGLSYYNNFISRFPTLMSLAKAEDDAVFKLWEGLGYYSRCKNLLFTARHISNNLNGKFPETYEQIVGLKGVGPYTAAAIASFAYGLPHAVVDGNVFRVLARYFGETIAIDSEKGKRYFADVAKKVLYRP
jgi:A/G-specific adenine glycosylase